MFLDSRILFSSLSVTIVFVSLVEREKDEERDKEREREQEGMARTKNPEKRSFFSGYVRVLFLPFFLRLFFHSTHSNST